jgi:hypothetical protein
MRPCDLKCKKLEKSDNKPFSWLKMGGKSAWSILALKDFKRRGLD